MDKKQIVFYCASHPFEMIYKIARVLKKNNYETVLVTMSERDRFDFNFYSKAFDRIICSDFQFFKPSLKILPYFFSRGLNFIKFLISIKFLRPYVFFGITGANWQVKLLHKYFFKKFPFIYFPYDIISHSFISKEYALTQGPPRFEINAERYCFENAQGVMHKGAVDELESKEDFIHENLKIPYLQLNFMPYCLKEFSIEINKNKLSKKDKQLHIVYVGGFPNEPNTKKRLYVFLEEAFKQSIHCHFYMKIEHISKNEEKEYIKDFFGPFSGNEFLHIHSKLDPKEIVPEISKYDFGLWTCYGLNVPEIKKGVGNKISTFFEAGIPMLYEPDATFVDKLMKSYGLQIYFDKSNLFKIRKVLEKLNRKEIEKRVIRARNDFDMEKNFPRLEKFMQDVVLSFKNRNLNVS